MVIARNPTNVATHRPQFECSHPSRSLHLFETGRVDSHRTDLRADFGQHGRIDSGVAKRCKGETDLAGVFQIFDGFSSRLITGDRNKFGGAGDRVTFESLGSEGLRLAGGESFRSTLVCPS